VIAYHPTALTATLSLEVAAVRSRHPRRCPVCGRKRVLYALTLTGSPLGNPDIQWRCAPDAGLREERERRVPAKARVQPGEEA
jgi:hypothetical protein